MGWENIEVTAIELDPELARMWHLDLNQSPNLILLNKAQAGNLIGDGWTVGIVEHIFSFLKGGGKKII